MDFIKKVLFRFAVVTTCICFCVPMFDILVNGGVEHLGRIDIMLLEIVCAAFLCALGEAIVYKLDKLTGKSLLVMFLHYIYINAVVIVFGCIVGWFDYTRPVEMIAISLLIFVIYIINVAASYLRDKQTSNKINDKLKELHEKNE